ncbi:MAG: hypothetical protein WA981_17605 [Glaciecola sp.]
MTDTEKNNKSSLLMMIGIFILPVILAYAALQLDWFNKAATNRGELLQPVIQAQDFLSDSDAKWHLMYVIPSNCDMACENAIYSVTQIYQATGKESDRVSKLFVVTSDSSKKALAQLESQHSAYVLQKSQENVNQVFQNVGIDAIFITDTLHNVVMRYPVTSVQEDAIMDSRNILADLKKLLKLSRIG